MTITIDERFNSREATEGPSPATELLYLVQGTEDDLQVKSLVAATAPTLYDGLVRDSFSVTPLGGGVWECSVRYTLLESETQFTFDTGGGTQHITQSLQTMGGYAPAGFTAPNFQGAMGVTTDSVEGTDITVPVYSFTETHYISGALVTPAYKATLFFLTGKVNGAAFKGFSVGEVLFLGAAGSKRGTDDWEITYRFAASPNVTGLAVGPITGIAKKGWEYLWVRYADAEDEHVLVKRPIAAYVEQVYELGNFAGLGIGT
jgi:hypothetical protein